MREISSRQRVYFAVKRLLDVFFATVLLLFLWLPMLLLWVAVRLDSRGGGIFRQKRVGKDGRIFTCYKFRTMYEDAPSERASSEFFDVERYVTPVGAFLRRSSLYELPQLFNVLKGDMSLVGPRPLIISEKTVHEGRMKNGVYYLRPGITGLSQIMGRDELGDQKKIELDTEYLSGFGLRQDIRILLSTVTKVIKGEGVRIK
mgnify:CR=1 FL=1